MFTFRRRTDAHTRANRKGDRPRGGAGEMEPVFSDPSADRIEASQGRIGLAASCSKEDTYFAVGEKRVDARRKDSTRGAVFARVGAFFRLAAHFGRREDGEGCPVSFFFADKENRLN